MKKIYTLLFAVISICFVNAQNPIPNPGFETWTNSSYPDGCSGGNLTKSTTAHSGQFAVKGLMQGVGSEPALLVGGSNGFPVSTTYAYLNFYYIFNKVGTEELDVQLFLDNDNLGTTVGFAGTAITATTATYKVASVPVSYVGPGATSGGIDIRLLNNTVGSYFIIDDVSLSNSPLAVEKIEKESSSLQLFPNPANNFVQLYFNELKQKTADIQITDLTGRTVKELSSVSLEQNTLTLDISALSAGNYIVAVKNDEMIQTKRLTVQ